MRRALLTLSVAAISMAALGSSSGATPDPSMEDKWSQPPIWVGVFNDDPVFQGFDEMSIVDTPYLAADDWLCTDTRPVVGIRWWGSYRNWVEKDPPMNSPNGFWFGMYADVPPGVDSDYSHPGELVWEFIGRDTQPQWIGYDDIHGIESLFEYEVLMPESEWFEQQGGDTIYWLSVAAIYVRGAPDAQQWGWSTRPFYFGDAAARSTLEDPFWEPNLSYYEVWDQAFSLTTPVPEPQFVGAVVILSGLIGAARAFRRRT